MDLSKLLQAKNKFSSFNPEEEEQTLKKQFLSNLCVQINKDLQLIVHHQKDPSLDFLKNCHAHFGSLKAQGKESFYIFLNLPEKPGLFLESAPEAQILHLFRASRIKPLVTDDCGEKSVEDLFIVRGSALHQFKILESDLVRFEDEKTLTKEQTSEMLILLAHSLHYGK